MNNGDNFRVAVSVTVGKLVRGVVGPRLFPALGTFYRSLFMDVDFVVESFVACLPAKGRVLDVGAGDGYLLNHLLRARPDLQATLLDTRDAIGAALEPAQKARVRLLPATDLAAYNRGDEVPDVLLVCDVLHHIPPDQRKDFFAEMKRLAARAGRLRVLMKEFEPRGVRGKLGLWSDLYISGDRGVRLLRRDELRGLIASTFGDVEIHELPLFAEDPPNYAFQFSTHP